MNDFTVGMLASQRQSDYVREVERAELVEEAKAAAAERGASERPASSITADPLRHRWQMAWAHLARPHPHLPGHGS
jgi:hypothetical protein